MVAVLDQAFNTPLTAEELFMAESSRSGKRSTHRLAEFWDYFEQRQGVLTPAKKNKRNPVTRPNSASAELYIFQLSSSTNSFQVYSVFSKRLCTSAVPRSKFNC